MNTTLHVIHDWGRKDRFELLCKEIADNNLSVIIWDACKESNSAKTNIARCHKRIVQFAKDNKMEEIIIAENDVHFTSPNSFKYFLDNKPTDFDLYLSSIHGGGISDKNETNSFSSLLCYIIHSRFYDTFLEADENTDIDRGMKGKGKFIVANPFVTIQHETFSDNAKKIHSNKKIYRNRSFYGQ